jgi:hypothetical protein
MGTALILAGIILAAYVVVRIRRHYNEKKEAERIAAEYAARRAALIAKYNDESIANAIMAGRIWQGMTEEQLVESCGRPEDKSVKVYKSKTVATFKYDQTGKNRFGKR